MQAKHNPTTRDQLEKLIDIGRRTLKYAWLVAVIGGLGAVLSVVAALSQKHTYESETVLLYQEKIAQSVLQGREAIQSTRKMSSRFKEMLLSRSTLSSVVEEKKLFPELVEEKGTIAAAEQLQSRIKFRDRGAGTFRISYRGDSRDEAQQITARLAALVREQDKRVRFEQANQTKDFLESQKIEAENDLIEAEEDLATFLAEHPEFAEITASGTDAMGAGIRAANSRKTTLSPGQSRLLTLERRRSRIRARLANPNAPLPVATPSRKARDTPLITAAKRDLAARQNALAEKSQKFTAIHPDVKAAQNAVAEAKLRLARAEAESGGGASESLPPIKSSVDKASLKRELAQIERELSAQKSQPSSQRNSKSSLTEKLINDETLFHSKSRMMEESRSRLETLEQKSFTASITATTEFVDAAQLVIIDEAFRPTNPAGRGRKLIAIAGTLVFGSLGLALAIGLALVDDRIYRRFDIDELGVAPVLAVVPRDEKASKKEKFIG